MEVAQLPVNRKQRWGEGGARPEQEERADGSWEEGRSKEQEERRWLRITAPAPSLTVAVSNQGQCPPPMAARVNGGVSGLELS